MASRTFSSGVAASLASRDLRPVPSTAASTDHRVRLMREHGAAPARPDAILPPDSLLARVAAGDERAVRACVEAYGGMLWTLANRWSAERHDAEDAVQEIFFDLWKSAARFDPARCSERGFVAMVARRRLIDRARKRQREIATDPYPDGFDVASEAPDHADAVGDALQAREVLARLTPMQRQLLERHLLDGRTHEEIAHESAMPLGTVKSHLRRGLLKARALLTGRPAAQESDA